MSANIQQHLIRLSRKKRFTVTDVGNLINSADRYIDLAWSARDTLSDLECFNGDEIVVSRFPMKGAVVLKGGRRFDEKYFFTCDTPQPHTFSLCAEELHAHFLRVPKVLYLKKKEA